MPSVTLILVVSVAIFQDVNCQLCTETKLTWREVPETYTYTYLEAYEKTDCLFWCTDSRIATAVGSRTVRKQAPEQVNICCHGYVKEKLLTDNSSSIYCTPICSRPCHNGYCKSPEVCECNPGYLPDNLEPHKCIPMCIEGCDHGNCTAPNICECDFGYELIGEICEPICHEPCDNGICMAPETCQCNPGYKKSEDGVCETYCSSYTNSGECVVTLICEPGWEKDLNGPFETCKPICTKPCDYGKCVTPDVCECFQGYKKSSTGSCEPHCTSGCPQGICVSPERCVCELGWFQKETDGACLAHCDRGCGNGTCTAPNICECLPGYKSEASILNEQDIIMTLCVPFCENCEGICIDPNVCICEWPLESVAVRDDGSSCDCLDNCSSTQYKCEKTICLLPTTTESNYEINVTELIINTIGSEDIPASAQDDLYNSSWFDTKWLYAMASLFLISLIVTIVMIIKKIRTKSSGFSNNEDDVSAVVHYKQTSFL